MAIKGQPKLLQFDPKVILQQTEDTLKAVTKANKKIDRLTGLIDSRSRGDNDRYVKSYDKRLDNINDDLNESLSALLQQ